MGVAQMCSMFYAEVHNCVCATLYSDTFISRSNDDTEAPEPSENHADDTDSDDDSDDYDQTLN